MDEYVAKYTNFIAGRVSVRNVVINKFTHMVTFLDFLCRDDFRHYYFDNENIRFDNTDRLVMFAILRSPPFLFESLMKTSWCGFYEKITCDIEKEYGIFHLSLYYESIETRHYTNLIFPKNFGMETLCAKNFKFDGEGAVYVYRNIK